MMSKETSSSNGTLSRRILLQRTAGLTGAAVALSLRARAALAAIKISKAAVAYQDHPDGDKECAKCTHFVAPAGCNMVDGQISPQGYCHIFAPLRQSSQRPGGAHEIG